MIAFKYTKTDGAEYLSHLDLLRHVYRTLRRAGVTVYMSGGYHAHAKIFLNNPLPVGVRSVAEYGAVETDFKGDFKAVFNEFSPNGIKCESFCTVDKNPNFANSIQSCDYTFSGAHAFNADLVLNEKSIIITDLRGREIDIRPRIYALQCENGRISCTLGCGNDNLRPDLFAGFVCSRFGGNAENILKLAAHGKGVF